MRLSISAILLFAAACSTVPEGGVEVPGGVQMYQGPFAQQQVRLQSADQWMRVRVIDGLRPIPGKDDTYVPMAIRRFQRPRERNYFLLPGKHVIGLFWSAPGYQGLTTTVWFEGEPGGTYLVRSQRDGMQIRFWVEDRRTGRPVGGAGTPQAAGKGDDD